MFVQGVLFCTCCIREGPVGRTLHKRKDQQYGKWNKFQLGWNGETGCAAIVKVDLKKHGMVEKKKQKTKQEEQPAHKALWQKI